MLLMLTFKYCSHISLPMTVSHEKANSSTMTFSMTLTLAAIQEMKCKYLLLSNKCDFGISKSFYMTPWFWCITFDHKAEQFCYPLPLLSYSKSWPFVNRKMPCKALDPIFSTSWWSRDTISLTTKMLGSSLDCLWYFDHESLEWCIIITGCFFVQSSNQQKFSHHPKCITKNLRRGRIMKLL